ncbi:glycosyltransferase [Niabella ginsengisoli]|uniref:Glycosyltransferase n=1 Tax=Niabella ginsengisoli TaxID=522298 RepID=A0ABS9SMB5_9BACT|nr:glycosyltransferase [Niabella ginsengisoli]
MKIGLNPLSHIKAHETIIQIKLFEYMNFSLPIIAGNFGYMKKYVEENGVGVCVPPDDPVALANAIKDLLLQPEKITQMGLNGVKAVDEKYNWQLMSRSYINIINGLINRV